MRAIYFSAPASLPEEGVRGGTSGNGRPSSSTPAQSWLARAPERGNRTGSREKVSPHLPWRQVTGTLPHLQRFHSP